MSNEQVQTVLGDMTEDEVEEFRLINQSRERGRLRNNMGASPLAHTSLWYVLCPDGLTRKMKPADAEAYMALYGSQGAEITRRGERPQPPETTSDSVEVLGDSHLGATKATIGPMFGSDGRQMADVQPLTTRSFMAEQMTRPEVHTPALGATGAHVDNSASTGSTETPTKPHVPRASVAKPATDTETPAAE